MRRIRLVRVVSTAVWTVLGFLLVHAAAPPVAGEESGPARWGDVAVLRRHLDAACAAVEEVCGTPFGTRPTVSVSTPEDIAQILRSRVGGEVGMLESTPDENRHYLAYYDPIAHRIHILPSTLGLVSRYFAAPDLLHEDVLRAVLVHEATHALDFQRFPVRWTLACCAASDERLATEAALEGHAQFVTEEICRRWGIEGAFQRLTRLYTGAMVRAGGAPENVGFDQEAAFAYVQGHDFVRTIHGLRGRTGVDAMLMDPPFETRVIDRPILWLDPAQRGREVDLQAVLEVFRPLVTPLDWEVAKWRVLGPATPPPVAGDAGAGEEAPEPESYLDNHGFYAGTPDGNRYFNVFLAYCRSEADAERFVRALEGVDEARDEDPKWQRAQRRAGAGPGGRLPGFTSRRRAANGSRDTELALQVVRQGSYVIEFSSYGLPDADQAARVHALDLAARLLRTSPPNAAAVALRSHVRSFLDARARGRLKQSATILRGLLPTGADLRRTVRSGSAAEFAADYGGLRLALRTDVVPNATVDSAFAGADPRTTVRAWAATTEQIAAGEGWASKFPDGMRAFARERAAPGMTWVVLSLTPPGGKERSYACFARFGDRFLFVKNPWAVLR